MGIMAESLPAFDKYRQDHLASLKDSFGAIVTDYSPPVSHPLLITEILYFNDAGEVVRWDKNFKTSQTDNTPVTYRQRIVPKSGDETIATNITFYPWVQV